MFKNLCVLILIFSFSSCFFGPLNDEGAAEENSAQEEASPETETLPKIHCVCQGKKKIARRNKKLAKDPIINTVQAEIQTYHEIEHVDHFHEISIPRL